MKKQMTTKSLILDGRIKKLGALIGIIYPLFSFTFVENRTFIDDTFTYAAAFLGLLLVFKSGDIGVAGAKRLGLDDDSDIVEANASSK